MIDEEEDYQYPPPTNNLSLRKTSPSRKLPSEKLITEDAVHRMNVIQNLKAFRRVYC
ncbi:MAG: hypothetical protein WAN66_26940 [Limnoraphis robusta]|uniref:hypothetical protein n=1 Tax=Limnoraphis robusta TaxID=1118279 RepID=UPI001364AF3F|nr:hypothetical protein [Limnoraphis robusta]